MNTEAVAIRQKKSTDPTANSRGLGDPSHRTILLIFVLALLASYAVLDRWAVTSLGLLSYGRVWQLYISYADFGFIKRGLIGTLFTETGINAVFRNEYHFAYAVHHAMIALIAGLTALYCRKARITDPLFVAGVAFSPVYIIYMGYDTGSLDVFVVAIAVCNILFVRNLALFTGLIVAGVLIHEVFVFTVPAQLVALSFAYRFRDKNGRSQVILIAVAGLVAAILAVSLGTPDIPQSAFEAIMRERLPIAQGQHPLWSGYFEVASSVQGNTDYVRDVRLRNVGLSYLLLLIPLSYVLILLRRLTGYAGNPVVALVMVGSVGAPLCAAFVATDLYRWISLSGIMALLLTLFWAGETGTTRSRYNWPLLLFCVLAPFGGAEINRPLPMHQFVVDRLLS